MKKILAVILLTLVGAPAWAEEPAAGQPSGNDMQRLYQYVLTKSYQTLSDSTALMGEEKIRPGCKAIKIKGRTAMSVLERPEFAPEAEFPRKGVWMDHVLMESCGKSSRQNLLLIAQKEGAPRAVTMIPGDTMASPVLQRDVFMSVSMAFMVQKKCQKGEVIPINSVLPPDQSSVVTKNGVKSIVGPWEEVWSLQGCGTQADYRVLMTPKPDGGTSFAASIIEPGK